MIRTKHYVLFSVIGVLVGESIASIPTRLNIGRLVSNPPFFTSRHRQHSPDKHKFQSRSLIPSLSTRGGEEEDNSLKNCFSVPSAKNLAILFSSFEAVHGSLFGLVPALAFSLTNSDVEKGTLPFCFAQCEGTVHIGSAITTFLSVASSNTSVEQAIGFGLIPRLVFLLHGLLSGRCSKMGLKSNVLSIFAMFLSASTCSLLSEKGKPLATAKAIAIMTGVGSTSVIFNTVATGTKVLDINLGEDGNEKAKGWYKSLGHAILASSVHIGSLAFGAEPITALGYTALTYSATNLDSIVTKNYENTGASRNLMIVHMAISGLCALRFLLG